MRSPSASPMSRGSTFSAVARLRRSWRALRAAASGFSGARPGLSASAATGSTGSGSRRRIAHTIAAMAAAVSVKSSTATATTSAVGVPGQAAAVCPCTTSAAKSKPNGATRPPVGQAAIRAATQIRPNTPAVPQHEARSTHPPIAPCGANPARGPIARVIAAPGSRRRCRTAHARRRPATVRRGCRAARRS